MAEQFRSHPDAERVERLRRFRIDELAEEGSPPVLDHSEHLLQLRVGVRHPAYVDKDTLDVRKIEGNPLHPGSRGRTCAKGVVTPNQLEDPDRVLFPLKRTGARGAAANGRASPGTKCSRTSAAASAGRFRKIAGMK